MTLHRYDVSNTIEASNIYCAECLTSYSPNQSPDMDRLVVCSRCMNNVCSPRAMTDCSIADDMGYLCRLCATQDVTMLFDM